MFNSVKKKIGTFIGPDPPMLLEEEHVLPREQGFNQELQLVGSSHEGSTLKYKTISPGRTAELVDIGMSGGLDHPLEISYRKQKPRE